MKNCKVEEREERWLKKKEIEKKNCAFDLCFERFFGWKIPFSYFSFFDFALGSLDNAISINPISTNSVSINVSMNLSNRTTPEEADGSNSIAGLKKKKQKTKKRKKWKRMEAEKNSQFFFFWFLLNFFFRSTFKNWKSNWYNPCCCCGKGEKKKSSWKEKRTKQRRKSNRKKKRKKKIVVTNVSCFRLRQDLRQDQLL